MSSFCKCENYSHFFRKNISIYAIFNDENFNDTLTNDIVSFDQLDLILSFVDKLFCWNYALYLSRKEIEYFPLITLWLGP